MMVVIMRQPFHRVTVCIKLVKRDLQEQTRADEMVFVDKPEPDVETANLTGP